MAPSSGEYRQACSAALRPADLPPAPPTASGPLKGLAARFEPMIGPAAKAAACVSMDEHGGLRSTRPVVRALDCQPNSMKSEKTVHFSLHAQRRDHSPAEQGKGLRRSASDGAQNSQRIGASKVQNTGLWVPPLTSEALQAQDSILEPALCQRNYGASKYRRCGRSKRAAPEIQSSAWPKLLALAHKSTRQASGLATRAAMPGSRKRASAPAATPPTCRLRIDPAAVHHPRARPAQPSSTSGSSSGHRSISTEMAPDTSAANLHHRSRASHRVRPAVAPVAARDCDPHREISASGRSTIV